MNLFSKIPNIAESLNLDKLHMTKHGLEVRLKEEQLESWMVEKMPSNMKNFKVQFSDDDTLKIKGQISKLGIPVKFSMTLKPEAVNGRVATFQIVEFKPLNAEKLKQKVLNRPPYLQYAANLVQIDLNGHPTLKKVPIGSIKSITIEEGEMNIGLSIK